VEIRDVTFRGAALQPSHRPDEWFPHVAIAGRSNVGKSSLLNWLFRRSVARVAKAPGKTRTLNFYLVNGSFYLVDLPGYGYAKVAKKLREEWGHQMGLYLSDEERLAAVVTLIDIRHGPSALDLDLQDLLLGVGRERLVVLTKADKVKRGHRTQMQREVQQRLGLPTPPMVASVKTGEGRRELIQKIDEFVSLWRQEHQRGD
jgi:GTP-binding protein